MAMKKFFVGVKGVIRDNNKILMVRGENARDFWDVPGGRIDNDETITETLKRELQEELPNLKSYNIGKLIGSQRVHRDIEDDISLLLLFFEVKDAAFEGTIALSDEHTESAWREISDAISDAQTSPAVRAALEQLTN